MTKKSATSRAKQKNSPLSGANLVSSMVPRRRVQTHAEGASLTEQSHADSCNVNTIMGRFIKTGNISHLNHRQPNFGYAPSHSFHEGLEAVRKAEEGFSELPVHLQEQFGTPAGMLEFLENPDNLPELADMGLLSPEATLMVKEGRLDVTGQAAASDSPSATTSGEAATEPTTE